MKYTSLIFIFFFLVLQSCGTKKIIETSIEERNYSSQEICALSQDYDFVRKNVKRGLKRKYEPVLKKRSKIAERKARKREQILANDPSWKYKRSKQDRTSKKEPKQKISRKTKKSYEEIVFLRNDFLVSFLKVTPCLEGETKEEIIKLFGSPFRNCEGCQNGHFTYYLHFEGK